MPIIIAFNVSQLSISGMKMMIAEPTVPQIIAIDAQKAKYPSLYFPAHKKSEDKSRKKINLEREMGFELTSWEGQKRPENDDNDSEQQPPLNNPRLRV